MSIAGTLRTMSFADVVQWLSVAKKTGTLVVDGPRYTKKLYLRHGNVVAVASDNPREMLGYYLVGWGYVNEEELHYLIAMQEHFRIMLGELLVKLNHLTRRELDRVLKVKTEESIYDLLSWEEGSFRFLDGELPERDFVEVDLAVQVSLLEGFRQRDERRRMIRLVPDVRHVPRVLSLPATATDEERTIAAAVDGRRSIASIALACRVPEFNVLAFVFSGIKADTIALDPPAEGDALLIGVSDAPWLVLARDAEDCIGRGRLLDAFRVIASLEEKFPDRPDAMAVVEGLRRGLEAELDRGALGKPAVLEPAVAVDKLIKLECDPAEGFVLSRITGLYTVEEVLNQLPGSRLANRVLLHNLLRRGLIKLRDSVAVRRYRQWSPIPAEIDDESLDVLTD